MSEIGNLSPSNVATPGSVFTKPPANEKDAEIIALAQSIKAHVNSRLHPSCSPIILEAYVKCAAQVNEFCAQLHRDLVNGEHHTAASLRETTQLLETAHERRNGHSIVLLGASTIAKPMMRRILDGGYKHATLVILVTYAEVGQLVQCGQWPSLDAYPHTRLFLWPEPISLLPPPPR